MPASPPASVIIRPGRPEDAAAVRDLYLVVAQISGGLARYPDEISIEYVTEFIGHSLGDGLFLVAEISGQPGLVGELHAYRSGLRRFDHVLSNLTVAVHPEAQGRGIGRKLFQALLTEVRTNRPGITRIELATQETNLRAQQLYQSVGFRRQGVFEEGIRSADGGFESDIYMAWLRSADSTDGEQHASTPQER